MHILSQGQHTEEEINCSISDFISVFKVRDVLHKCNAEKQKGISAMNIFRYKLVNVFSKSSFYMQVKTNHFSESYSKNTFYRFLNDPRINWLRFTTMLALAVIKNFFNPLTSNDRADVFIIDDSLYERAGYKRTQMASKVFDHVTMKYKKGFRLLTLGWSDGNSFVPINSCLLASSKEDNQLGDFTKVDSRSLAGRRRKMAVTKAPDVLLELLRYAVNAGHSAKYVLFDSWFSNPNTIVKIKEMHLNTIAMVKISSKITYEYEGSRLNIKQIYSRNKKRRGRSKYLLSVDVKVGKGTKDEPSIPAKIVCVRNRSNKKDWLAIICTDTALSEDEIIRVYGKRWNIEIFFKTCKSLLQLRTECHSLSYDALTAHVSIVFARYMFLSVYQRKDEDERTIGEIFYVLLQEMEDITFQHSLFILVEAMTASIKNILHITDEQVEEIYKDFFFRLPEYMQDALTRDYKVA
ncbi:IS4 family transposase [Oribacterium sp. P6A1]|uniref:IS4 family transposase n=1 Tax=Oribacterium sp. P6A1 TaxID=1410612 RepID=UPI00056465F7|nr:transposase [Oribacterium sp. P6A1]